MSSGALPIAGIAILGALYVRGVWRLGASPRQAPSMSRWRFVCFLSGAVAVAVALLPPIDHLAETSLAAHMLQHLLLVAVGAPLMAFGRPLTVLAMAGAPVRAVVRRVGPLARGLLAWPIAVWIAHTTVLWVWHMPSFYMAALSDSLLHALEHVSLLASGVLFWLVVAEPGVHARLGSVAAAGYLFAAALQCGTLGALLTLSTTPWYPEAASAGSDPLADQQLAGVLMWVPATLVYLAGTLAILAGPLKATDQTSG
jgi:putative membrane protein